MKNIKLSLLFLLLIGFCGTAKAQHDPSDQIISANWDVIGSVDFKTGKNSEEFAIFGPEIKKYANKAFELEGYIVPIKDGMKQTKFFLSTLPINQCFFCGKNGIPIMVMVELTEPIKFGYQTVKVKGNLKLSTASSLVEPPITLTAAKAL